MKKYLVKTVAVFLMTGIFFMATGFCFHNLLTPKPIIQLNIAQAASYNVAGSCGNESTDKQISQPVMSAQTTSHHNSILPCCLDEGHPTLSTLSKSFEITKFIPTLFFTENQILKTVYKTVAYHPLIIAPPELLALRVTILRI